MRTLGLLLVVLSIATAASAATMNEERATGVWPFAAPPEVSRNFARPAHNWLPGHRGVDLPTAPGAVVLAPISGTIDVASTIVDRGVVVIRAGDMRISLEPVTATQPVGTYVRAGEQVGTIGPGRSHCEPARCLHWGLRVDGVYHDPLLLVRAYRAVLLP